MLFKPFQKSFSRNPLLSTALVSASLALTACGGGSGSSSSGDNNEAPPPVATNYSVAIEDLTFTIPQTASTVSQAPTLSQYDIAIVSLNSEGLIQESFDISELVETENGASFSLFEAPRIDLALVVLFGGTLDLRAGDPLPQNALLAPLSAEQFDISLTSTSAYRLFLQSAIDLLSEQGSTNLQDLTYSPEQLEELINEIQAVTEDLELPDYTDESVSELVNYHTHRSAQQAEFMIGREVSSVETTLAELLAEGDLYQLDQSVDIGFRQYDENLEYRVYSNEQFVDLFTWEIDVDQESNPCDYNPSLSCGSIYIINPLFQDGYPGLQSTLLWNGSEWVENNRFYWLEIDGDNVLLNNGSTDSVAWQVSASSADGSGLSIHTLVNEFTELSFWQEFIDPNATFSDGSIISDITLSPLQDTYHLFPGTFSVYTHVSDESVRVINVPNLEDLLTQVDDSYASTEVNEDLRLVEIDDSRIGENTYRYLYLELLTDGSTHYYEYIQRAGEEDTPLVHVATGEYQVETLAGEQTNTIVYSIRHPEQIRNQMEIEFRGTLFSAVDGDVNRGQFFPEGEGRSDTPLMNQTALDSVLNSLTADYYGLDCEAYLQTDFAQTISYRGFRYLLSNCSFPRSITESLLEEIESFIPRGLLGDALGPTQLQIANGQYQETIDLADLFSYINVSVPEDVDTETLITGNYELNDSGTMTLVYDSGDANRLLSSVLGFEVDDQEFAYISLMEWSYIGRETLDGEIILEFLSFSKPYSGEQFFNDEDEGTVVIGQFILSSEE